MSLSDDDEQYVPDGLRRRREMEENALRRLAAGGRTSRDQVVAFEPPEEPRSHLSPAKPKAQTRSRAPTARTERDDFADFRELFGNLEPQVVEFDFGNITLAAQTRGWVESATVIAFWMSATTTLKIRNAVGQDLKIRRLPDGAPIDVVALGGELTPYPTAHLRLWVLVKKHGLAATLAAQ